MTSTGTPTAREYFYTRTKDLGAKYFRDISSNELKQNHQDYTIRWSNKDGNYLPSVELYIDDILSSDTHSNHGSIEAAFKRLKAINSNWVPNEFFEDIFIGVARQSSIEAMAIHRNKEYNGKLILVSEGILDFVEFFTRLFYFFVEFVGEMHECNEQKLSQFFSDIEKVMYAWRGQNAQKLQRSYSSICKKYDIKDNNNAFLSNKAAEYFIVGHEIAHHLLGDTGYGSPTCNELDELKRLISECQEYTQSVYEYRADEEELLADLVAVFFFIGNPIDVLECSRPNMHLAVHGAVHALGSLSLIIDNKKAGVVDSSDVLRRLLSVTVVLDEIIERVAPNNDDERELHVLTSRDLQLVPHFVSMVLAQYRGWDSSSSEG